MKSEPPSIRERLRQQSGAYVVKTARLGRRASERPKPRSDDASDVTRFIRVTGFSARLVSVMFPNCECKFV